ncbi:MAG: topoisomerase C-terminal repeat-containing protein [Clostridia bacterium]|nr:topoisomerase C-terminal repeat-containing protein [Clostridia bacterium]
MQLIIAEKPSLGRNIVASIEEGNKDKLNKKNGYYEGEHYIVTWAFGHLFSLADIEDYSPLPQGKTRWSMENLPCFPQQFRYHLKTNPDKTDDEGVVRQFNTIRMLCLRDTTDTIINAGDSDREGEIIVRTCVDKAFEGKITKPFKRLWLPDQTAQTILAALEQLPDESNYDNLAREGYARTYIDWLYGVNLTRYATLKTGTLLRVGRVIIPIVKAIYDRDMAIKNFVPDIYYAIISRAETNGEVVELVSKTKFTKEEKAKAEAFCQKYNEAPATVTAVKKRKTTLNPGKLYSLSTLQNTLGKKHKMPMEESLAIVQKLYEAGYLIYPRTNSEYLATAEQDKIKKVLEGVKKLGYPVEFKFKKTIFDDSKIESHSALTPTYKIPNKAALSEKEYIVYSTVMRRFVAVFCAEECLAEKTEITIDVGGMEEFLLKGTVIVSPGWMKYDDGGQKDKMLPNLAKGDLVNTAFAPVEKETTPPKHYTIETLNNYLKNPFREEKASIETEDDAEEYRAIFEGLELGTEATRTGIIDNARKSEYILLKKDVYTILPKGIYLIEALMRMKISMDKYKTSELGKALKQVFRGEITVDDGVRLAQTEISQVFDSVHLQATPETDEYDGFYGDEVGICPLCGGKVVKGRYGYGCLNYKEKNCKFTIWNTMCSRIIPLSAARSLLETGTTAKLQGFVSPRTGKTFDAKLKIDPETKRPTFDF